MKDKANANDILNLIRRYQQYGSTSKKNAPKDYREWEDLTPQEQTYELLRRKPNALNSSKLKQLLSQIKPTPNLNILNKIRQRQKK